MLAIFRADSTSCLLTEFISESNFPLQMWLCQKALREWTARVRQWTTHVQWDTMWSCGYFNCPRRCVITLCIELWLCVVNYDVVYCRVTHCVYWLSGGLLCDSLCVLNDVLKSDSLCDSLYRRWTSQLCTRKRSPSLRAMQKRAEWASWKEVLINKSATYYFLIISSR